MLGFDEHINHLGLAVVLRPAVGVLGLEVLDLLEEMVDLALGFVAEDLHSDNPYCHSERVPIHAWYR